MATQDISLGKLPHRQLDTLLDSVRRTLTRDVVVGPQVGVDAAVVRHTKNLLAVTMDPITFAGGRLCEYAVWVNANDLAVMGARPKWMVATLLLDAAHKRKVATYFSSLADCAQRLGVAVVGGHVEVTDAVTRPVMVGAMLGEPVSNRHVTSGGVQDGDVIIASRSAGIEATAVIAGDFEDRLRAAGVPGAVVQRAKGFLDDPGISVVDAALRAARLGVHAMHDPTEGGVIAGLWEMANASNMQLQIDTEAIVIDNDTRLVCEAVDIDPLRALGSGSLLLAASEQQAPGILRSLRRAKVPATVIGRAHTTDKSGLVDAHTGRPIKASSVDQITRLYQ